ncbi:unnamed protein product, partial [Amoebophrya sp. A25]
TSGGALVLDPPDMLNSNNSPAAPDHKNVDCSVTKEINTRPSHKMNTKNTDISNSNILGGTCSEQIDEQA